VVEGTGSEMRHYKTGCVEVTDEPTLVCVFTQDISSALVRNIGETTVYVGGENVCAEGDDMGMPIQVSDMGPTSLPSFEYDIVPLYAVTEQGETGKLVFLVSS
jgi:hypothetical protein